MAMRSLLVVMLAIVAMPPTVGASRVAAVVERGGLSLGGEVAQAAAAAADTAHRYAGKLHKRFNEIKYLPGHTKRNDFVKPLPGSYVDVAAMPTDFHWGNVSGRSYLTYMFNQHIPQCRFAALPHVRLLASAEGSSKG
jgi:hypothetical protein